MSDTANDEGSAKRKLQGSNFWGWGGGYPGWGGGGWGGYPGGGWGGSNSYANAAASAGEQQQGMAVLAA